MGYCGTIGTCWSAIVTMLGVHYLYFGVHFTSLEDPNKDANAAAYMESTLVSLKCPQDPDWWFWNGHCYYVEKEVQKSWSDAKTACNHYKGTGLLIIDSLEEKEWVSNMIKGSSWIGLNDMDKDGKWTWGEEEAANISAAWLSDINPDQSGCVEVDSSGKFWTRADCAALKLWICEGDEVHLHGWSRDRRALSSYACAPGFYGINCSSKCYECPRGIACNSVTGLCDSLVTCLVGPDLSGCQKAVSLECPQGPGWWYWGGHCYYISKARETKTFDDAKTACSVYRGTWLLTINSLEEMEWVSSMIDVKVWTGLRTVTRGIVWTWDDGQKPNTSASWFKIAPLGFIVNTFCVDLSPTPGALAAQDCLIPHRWVCEQPAVDLFQEHLKHALLHPLTYTFDTLVNAKEACMLELQNCSGVTEWKGRFVLVSGKELIAASSDPVTAYFKTACAPGFYGINCSSKCYECPGGIACNSVTGICDSLVTCLFGLNLSGCQKAVSLECPQESGWWYWDEHCYYISEPGENKTFYDAKAACSFYRGTWLLTINSLEEMEWVSSMIDVKVWTGLHTDTHGIFWAWDDGQKPNTSASWFNIASLTIKLYTFCVDLSPTPAALEAQDCIIPHRWVCEQRGVSTFELYKEMILLDPLPKNIKGHTELIPAVDGCLAQIPQCTGVTFWKGLYYAVTGGVLVKSKHLKDLTLIRTACSQGYFGPKCGQPCQVCKKGLVCNSLQGDCQGKHTCVSTTELSDCIFALVSILCPSDDWRVWKGHCYYIETRARKKGQDALLFCERFRETDLVSIGTKERENWILRAIDQINKVSVDNNTSYWLQGSGTPGASICTVFTAGGQQLSRACNSTSFFICEGTEGLLSRCPPGPRWQYWRGSCYFQDLSLLRTWREALLICNSYKETQLLYLTSDEEMYAVSSIYNGIHWTGLNDQNLESVFVWTTGEPISPEFTKYLKDDMADGGLKDCAQINITAGILTDINCNVKKSFICKCDEDTEWFDEKEGYPGSLSIIYPAETNLTEAKEECQRQRAICLAILHTDNETKFFLLNFTTAVEPNADTTVYQLNYCAYGIRGKQCIVPTKPTEIPNCDCSDSTTPSVQSVCNFTKEDCIAHCIKRKLSKHCSKCIPICPAGGGKVFSSKELALISLMEHKAEQFLTLSTDEDIEPQNASKNILYSFTFP